MINIDDSIIIAQILNGETRKYSLLVKKYKRMVYSIAYKVLKNREDAEDTSQDVFVKVYKSLNQYSSESKFSTWIYKIAFNMTISKARKKKIKISNLDLSDDKIYQSSDINHGYENLLREEKKTMVEIALKELGEIEYLIVILYYYEDKSIEEISIITTLSKSNIKTLLFRARKKLFTAISRYSDSKMEYMQ